MITLDEQPNQQHMENWFIQLTQGDNPILQSGALAMTTPKFHSCDLANKELAFTFQTRDWQSYANGGLHPGLVTMSFDTTFGLLCHYFAKQKMICTVNLNTSFLHPIPQDKEVVYRAKILSFGKTIATMRGEAYLAEDESKILATADTTFMILNQVLPGKI